MTPIVLSRDSQKFLAGLDAKQYRQLGKRIFELQENSLPHDCRHLAGHPGYLRISVGEYRVIYCPKTSVIEITVIDKRNDDSAYKKLDRK